MDLACSAIFCFNSEKKVFCSIFITLMHFFHTSWPFLNGYARRPFLFWKNHSITIYDLFVHVYVIKRAGLILPLEYRLHINSKDDPRVSIMKLRQPGFPACAFSSFLRSTAIPEAIKIQPRFHCTVTLRENSIHTTIFTIFYQSVQNFMIGHEIFSNDM